MAATVARGQQQDPVSQSCDASFRGSVIGPDAQAYIGVVQTFHTSSTDGFGCGTVKSNNMEPFEAIHWALDLLNKESGEVDGTGTIQDSYIPGIKLGEWYTRWGQYCSNICTM